MKADKRAIIEYLRKIKPLLNAQGFSQVALFGSFAKDQATVYSDIDIAVGKADDYLSEKSAYEYFDDIEQIKTLVRNKFHRNTDVFDLDSTSPLLDDIRKELIYV